ncbi:MAG: hypothetical protein EZS28_045502, partial [Streblomastix strix]
MNHGKFRKTRVQSPQGPFNPAHQLERTIITIPEMRLLSKAEEAQKHYICELSNSIMTDPVSMDGPHYYQRSELMAYIQDQGISPVTYEARTVNDIQEEHALKAEIQSLEVEQDDTIESVKRNICEKEGITVELQRLNNAGRNLDDEKTLQDCNIKGGTTLHLVIKSLPKNLKIFVKTDYGKTLELDVKNTDSYLKVKS